MIYNEMSNLLASVWRQTVKAIQGRRQRRASVDEIAYLDAQEMTCLARDLATSADELRILAGKDKGSADLLVRRMKTLGLEPRRVDPIVMRDLERCCSKCADKGLCVHELEDKPRDPTWPKYCPNEQTLAALKGDERCSP